MSLVEDLGAYDNPCGYCKSARRSFRSRGLWAHTLSVQDYQDLLDRGWRRSGMLLYKPCMKETCCPPYTIRLNVDNFVASKDQIRVLRRMQRYLDGTYHGPQTVGDLREDKDEDDERDGSVPVDLNMASSSEVEAKDTSLHLRRPGIRNSIDVARAYSVEEDTLIRTLEDSLKASVRNCVEKRLFPQRLEVPQFSVKPISRKVKAKTTEDSEASYTSNIAFLLFSALKRNERAGSGEKVESEKAQDSNLPLEEIKRWTPQEIADNLVKSLTEVCHPLVSSVKACRGHVNFHLTDKNAFEQKVVEDGGNSSRAKVGVRSDVMQYVSTGGPHQLEVRMSRSSFIEEEYALYRRYQIYVHDENPEDVRPGSYRRFLVDSPLVFVPPTNDGTTPSCGFGSFHQQYRLGGKLVAVGVVDILPYCLSSTYLFWDPDFAFLSLGKFSALKEIEWVQKEHRVCRSQLYYYLGYYIHSCPKMRYKSAYFPSELLCPERYRWVSFDLARSALDKSTYACLSNAIEGDNCTDDGEARADQNADLLFSGRSNGWNTSASNHHVTGTRKSSDVTAF